MANETALVVIEKKDVATVFTAEGYEAFIKRCRDEALSVVQDISTEAGRDAIRSMAYKVARTKTTFDNLGKELKAEHKAKCDAIDADRNKGVAALQALQDEVRKPLTEWENKEAERVKGHEEALIALAVWKNWAIANAAGLASTQDELKNALAKSKEIMEGRDWQEFSVRAGMQFIANEEALNIALKTRIETDEKAAELERLRQEQEAAAQKKRDEEIAAEAAAKAKKEAEEKAAKEAEEAAAAAKAEQDRLEAEKIAANAKATLEAARAEEAEHRELAAIAQAFDDKIKAEEETKRREAAAAQKVIDDAAKAKKIEADAAAAREADKNHKKKINNEALDAIEEIYGAYHGEKNEELCRKIVEAIARGKVPHVSIKY